MHDINIFFKCLLEAVIVPGEQVEPSDAGVNVHAHVDVGLLQVDVVDPRTQLEEGRAPGVNADGWWIAYWNQMHTLNIFSEIYIHLLIQVYNFLGGGSLTETIRTS